MLHYRTKCLAVLLALSPLLVSCAPTKKAAHTGPQHPKLVTSEEHMKHVTDKMTNDAGNPFAALAGISAMLQELCNFQATTGGTAWGAKGRNVKIAEQIVNEGAHSKGLRFVIRGPALTSGILAPPKKITFTSLEDPPKPKRPAADLANPEATMIAAMAASTTPGATGKVLKEEELTLFVAAANGSWAGNLPEFPYQSRINIKLSIPAQQVGTGDLKIDVFPSDPEGSTKANFLTHVTVRDPAEDRRRMEEMEDSGAIGGPDDDE